MAIVTRADLALAVHEEAGLTRRAARILVDSLFEEMAACLVAGEEVGIYGFGSFGLRDKAECKIWPHLTAVLNLSDRNSDFI